MSRRVLLFNPAKRDYFSMERIHMGLTLIGQILKSGGHEPMVIDYAFLRDMESKVKVPGVKEAVRDFKPDVIGISVFTYLLDECKAMIDEISRCCNVPVIVGGPHLTIFPDDFSHDKRVSYVVRGEAESVILDLVSNARQEKEPVVIDCPLPSADEIPAINLDIAFGVEHLTSYQIQLSRGCPYSCSFCNINAISGRKVRKRDIDDCMKQIIEAKERYPSLRVVSITDDCPTADKERFKSFLRSYKDADLRCELTVDNMRADMLDKEMVRMYASCGGQNICLGVESGDPEVFSMVHKGESLNDIINAARLIRESGLTLGLCFVIGLPGDNMKRHIASLKLARSLKPDYVFWNMCIPWPGTEVGRWYEKNGKVGKLSDFSTLIDPEGNYTVPPASTPDFPVRDRIRAWLMANMETYWFPLKYKSISRLIRKAHEYKLYRSFTVYIIGAAFHSIKIKWHKVNLSLKQFGVKYLLKRLFGKIKRLAFSR